MSSIGLEEFPVAKPARFSAALWAERSTQRHSPAVSVTSGHGLQLSFMRHASKTSVPESQTFAQLPPPPAAVSITVAAARSLRAERIIASRCRRGAYPGGRARGWRCVATTWPGREPTADMPLGKIGAMNAIVDLDPIYTRSKIPRDRIDNFSERWIQWNRFVGLSGIDSIVLAGRESLPVARRGAAIRPVRPSLSLPPRMSITLSQLDEEVTKAAKAARSIRPEGASAATRARTTTSPTRRA